MKVRTLNKITVVILVAAAVIAVIAIVIELYS